MAQSRVPAHSCVRCHRKRFMQIELFHYERRVLEALEQEFRLERRLVAGFALSLNQLRRLCEDVALSNEMEFKEGRLVLVGFINRTHNLLIGGLQALEAGNGHVWSTCVRGLMETFGACALVSKNPTIAPNFLGNGIPAGKLRAVADRAQPGLGRDIGKLNSIVHPGPGSIHDGFQVTDAKTHTAHFQFGLRKPTAHDGREGVIVLANLASLIADKLQELALRQEVLNAGKIVMQRTIDGQDGT